MEYMIRAVNASVGAIEISIQTQGSRMITHERGDDVVDDGWEFHPE
jgi:hypothetical protein